MKNIVLMSGGVDSLTTVLMLKKEHVEFEPLFVHLGHRYWEAEWWTVRNLTFELKMGFTMLVLEGIGQFEREDAEIPFRNDILVISAVLFGARNIYLSIEEGTEENISRDRSPTFINMLSEYLSWRVGENVKIINLVGQYTKMDEMIWIWYNYRDYGRRLLLETFSCYSPQLDLKTGTWKMCGNCSACIRWYLAGVGANIERQDWWSDPLKSKKLIEYLEATRQGKYKGRRGEQYKIVFEKLGLWRENKENLDKK